APGSGHVPWPRSRQPQFACAGSHRYIVDFEIDQVALTVRYIIAAFADSFRPIGVIELARLAHITAAQAYPLSVNAREIRLAADARAIAGVQRVIPDIQLISVGRIHRGYEVYEFVRHADDIFVCADAIEGRHLVSRKLFLCQGQPPAGMRKTGDRALSLCPA